MHDGPCKIGYLGAALGVAVLGTAVLGVAVLGTAVLQPGIAPVSPALAVTLGCAPFSQSEHHTHTVQLRPLF